jgi:hypothetical protein
MGKKAIFLGFDPGFTTGFAQAELDYDYNALIVTNLNPIPLNTRHPTIKMENPPIPCFSDFWERVTDIYQECYEDVLEFGGDPVITHTAIEDFVGGRGGDIQNTVNKLIGIIMGVAFAANVTHFSEPKVYRNKSRIKYLPQVTAITAGIQGISNHSKDALAHLLHRVFQENSEGFATMKVTVDLGA